MGEIILGKCDFMKYTGRRYSYEWDCCWLGWTLAQLNPLLLSQRGLLLRATQLVTHMFQGCLSRIKRKNARPGYNNPVVWLIESRGLNNFMMTRPRWLPGLASDPQTKAALHKVHEGLKHKYHQFRSDGYSAKSASQKVVLCYKEYVHEGVAMERAGPESGDQ